MFLIKWSIRYFVKKKKIKIKISINHSSWLYDSTDFPNNKSFNTRNLVKFPEYMLFIHLLKLCFIYFYIYILAMNTRIVLTENHTNSKVKYCIFWKLLRHIFPDPLLDKTKKNAPIKLQRASMQCTLFFLHKKTIFSTMRVSAMSSGAICYV